MTLLLVYVAFTALAIASVARRMLRGTYGRVHPRYEPALLPKLAPIDEARFEAWGRELEGAGYRAVGDHMASVPAIPGRPPPRPTYVRVYVSPDERTVAAASVVHTPMDGSKGAPTLSAAWLAFVSIDDTGRIVRSSNALSPALAGAPANHTATRHPGLRRATDLAAAHARAVAAALPAGPSRIVDPVTTAERVAGECIAHEIRVGAWRVDGELVVLTPSFGTLAILASSNPFTGEARRPIANAGLVAGGVLAALAIALGLLRLGTADDATLAASLAYAGLATVTFVLFPRSGALTLPFVMLGGLPLWQARSDDGSTPLCIAIVTGVTLGPFLVRRLAGVGPGAAPSPEPAWVANARVFALGGSAVAGLATYVLMRLPMPTAGEALLRGALVFLGCAALALLAPLTTLLWFVPSLRHRTWFYVLQTITLAGLPPTVGAGAGFLAAVDDDVAAHRQGQAVVTALEAHRAANGELPESLDALVPARLPAPPTTGLWPLRVAFRYRRLTPETFELSYTSPSGPRYFTSSLGRFLAVPWTGPPPARPSRGSSSASPSAAPPMLEPSADDPLPLPALLTHGASRRAARGACSARARGRAARSGSARRWRARADRGGCSA